MGTFDLVAVKIKGLVTQGRPFEWDRELADSNGNDKDGAPLIPTRYMTTCPFCAQLINFRPEELYDDNNLKCSSCDAHTPPTNSDPAGIEMVTVQTVEPITIAEEMSQEDQNPFVDPVLNRSIDTSNYE